MLGQSKSIKKVVFEIKVEQSSKTTCCGLFQSVCLLVDPVSEWPSSPIHPPTVDRPGDSDETVETVSQTDLNNRSFKGCDTVNKNGHPYLPFHPKMVEVAWTNLHHSRHSPLTARSQVLRTLPARSGPFQVGWSRKESKLPNKLEQRIISVSLHFCARILACETK